MYWVIPRSPAQRPPAQRPPAKRAPQNAPCLLLPRAERKRARTERLEHQLGRMVQYYLPGAGPEPAAAAVAQAAEAAPPSEPPHAVVHAASALTAIQRAFPLLHSPTGHRTPSAPPAPPPPPPLQQRLAQQQQQQPLVFPLFPSLAPLQVRQPRAAPGGWLAQPTSARSSAAAGTPSAAAAPASGAQPPALQQAWPRPPQLQPQPLASTSAQMTAAVVSHMRAWAAAHMPGIATRHGLAQELPHSTVAPHAPPLPTGWLQQQVGGGATPTAGAAAAALAPPPVGPPLPVGDVAALLRQRMVRAAEMSRAYVRHQAPPAAALAAAPPAAPSSATASAAAATGEPWRQRLAFGPSPAPAPPSPSTAAPMGLAWQAGAARAEARPQPSEAGPAPATEADGRAAAGAAAGAAGDDAAGPMELPGCGSCGRACGGSCSTTPRCPQADGGEADGVPGSPFVIRGGGAGLLTPECASQQRRDELEEGDEEEGGGGGMGDASREASHGMAAVDWGTGGEEPAPARGTVELAPAATGGAGMEPSRPVDADEGRAAAEPSTSRAGAAGRAIPWASSSPFAAPAGAGAALGSRSTAPPGGPGPAPALAAAAAASPALPLRTTPAASFRTFFASASAAPASEGRPGRAPASAPGTGASGGGLAPGGMPSPFEYATQAQRWQAWHRPVEDAAVRQDVAQALVRTLHSRRPDMGAWLRCARVAWLGCGARKGRPAAQRTAEHPPLSPLHLQTLCPAPAALAARSDKMPEFARRLEEALYRSAPSLDGYRDAATLESRVLDVARRVVSRCVLRPGACARRPPLRGRGRGGRGQRTSARVRPAGPFRHPTSDACWPHWPASPTPQALFGAAHALAVAVGAAAAGARPGPAVRPRPPCVRGVTCLANCWVVYGWVIVRRHGGTGLYEERGWKMDGRGCFERGRSVRPHFREGGSPTDLRIAIGHFATSASVGCGMGGASLLLFEQGSLALGRIRPKGGDGWDS
jgi:hypothetical protein